MSSNILPIPPELLQNKQLTSNQKLILSLTSTKEKFYSLEIAKSLGTRRNQIQNDLDTLVSQGLLSSSNGRGRVEYSLQEGSYVVSTQQNIDITKKNNEPLKRLKCDSGDSISERSEEILSKESHKIRQSNTNTPPATAPAPAAPAQTLLYKRNIQKKVNLAIEYWIDRGGMKHKQGSGTMKDVQTLLTKLFTGQAFRHVPETVIPNPLLNKKKIFDLEDFKTSLDNYIMSIESPAHHPISKQPRIKARKRLSLNKFIYNQFVIEGTPRSLFLKYLDPPKLIHQEVAKRPELTKQLKLAFDRLKLPRPPTESQIICASNKFAALITKHNIRRVSIVGTAELFTDFIDKQMDKARLEPRWIISDWFIFKFEKWLDRQGIINLEE